MNETINEENKIVVGRGVAHLAGQLHDLVGAALQFVGALLQLALCAVQVLLGAVQLHLDRLAVAALAVQQVAHEPRHVADRLSQLARLVWADRQT